MVDFEYCRLGPAAYDLAYFLFSCISEDDLEHFDVFQEVLLLQLLRLSDLNLRISGESTHSSG
jgi:thiamine kinase-like enzyme